MAHEPHIAAQLRVLTSTPMTAMPMLVAAKATPNEAVLRLRQALYAVRDEPALQAIRGALLLDGFAPVEASRYQDLVIQATAIDQCGYRFIR